jgi:hypothetical protein
VKKLVLGSEVACCFVLFACGGTNPEGTGYVLLDPEARASGLSVQVAGRALTSVLPVEVGAHERASIVGPAKNEALDVGDGELVYVRGPGAAVSRYTIGKNVADDRLKIDGDRSAIDAFARQVGGRVEESGRELRLVVPGAYIAAATSPVEVEGVDVGPVVLDGAVVTMTDDPATTTAPAPAEAIRCDGVAGTWRGLVYSERHGAYYDFTLAVRQPSKSSPTLVGTIVSHSWEAPLGGDVAPDTCSGDEHWTVVEDAKGTVSADGAVDFRAQSWHVASAACGTSPRKYWLDKFRIPGALGVSKAEGVISDDNVWADGLGLAFTRVACP